MTTARLYPLSAPVLSGNPPAGGAAVVALPSQGEAIALAALLPAGPGAIAEVRFGAGPAGPFYGPVLVRPGETLITRDAHALGSTHAAVSHAPLLVARGTLENSIEGRLLP